jgi:FkbH-like protein
MDRVSIPTTVDREDRPSAGDESGLSRRERRRLARALAAKRSVIWSGWWTSQFSPARLQRYGVTSADEQTHEIILDLYLRPAVELLIAYIRTGEDRYRDVYLNERLRFAPHRASPEVRAEFFNEVLDADEQAILDEVSLPGDSKQTLHGLLRELHAPLRSLPGESPVRLLAVGDCLLTEIRVSLPGICRRVGLGLDMRNLYFNALSGRSISADQVVAFLKEFPADLIALSFLSYEGLPFYPAFLREAGRLGAYEIDQRVTGIIKLVRDFLGQLRECTDAPFLVHNASGLPLTRLRKRLNLLAPLSPSRQRALAALNAAIAELVANTPKTLLLDEAAVARTHGYRACGSAIIPRRVVGKAFFHTSRFGEYLATPYADVLRSYRELGKAKVVLVDFDNTLWDGVMADGPVTQNHELQRLLRRIKDAGILLVGISKNDLANICWDEMTLKPDDFVLLKLNWNLKVQSIQETAQELDLGLDSFVFIDDNPVERELVRTQLPKVRILDPNDAKTVRWIERMLDFPNTRTTEEALQRTALYRKQVRRREALSQAFDYPAMMASLDLNARFGLARPIDLERVTELVQRTNQFNTTTIRYSKQQLQSLMASDRHGVYVATLFDKFGSVGLVCVAIIERRGPERIFDSFIMSCRAMGFELERLMLRLVLDAEAERTERFIGRFLPTDRNTPTRDLFSSNGFVARGDTEWLLEAAAARPEKPAWFTVLDF